jgi:D-alanyl-lipoteichoic acid acyltransferase DltB (MBOAT superfamily)
MHSTLTLIVTALLYPLQLYADFGGYTDIARGVGKLLGFDLMVNFRTPYINSTSVTDYWKRNHISLTTWLKDYVFFPFMGTSSSKVKIYIGIIIMFLASGIWHGVGWMFIIWGAIQAIYLIVEDLFGWDKKFIGNKITRSLKKMFTYIVISAGLVFFRIPSLKELGHMLNSILSSNWTLYIGGSSTSVFIAIGVMMLLVLEIILDKKQIDQWIAEKHIVLRWGSYLSLMIVILLVGVLDGQAFIYFQF